MNTNDQYSDNVAEYMDVGDEDTFGSPPGSVELGLGITINMKDFQSFKLSLNLNEPYTGRAGDTREDKVEELFSFITDKLYEKAEKLSGTTKLVLTGIRENIESQ